MSFVNDKVYSLAVRTTQNYAELVDFSRSPNTTEPKHNERPLLYVHSIKFQEPMFWTSGFRHDAGRLNVIHDSVSSIERILKQRIHFN